MEIILSTIFILLSDCYLCFIYQISHCEKILDSEKVSSLPIMASREITQQGVSKNKSNRKCKIQSMEFWCLAPADTPSHVFMAFLLTPPFTITHSCPESCVSAQLPSPARRKQETGVEVGVHSVINASVSQKGVGGGMVREEGGRRRAADRKREERKRVLEHKAV